MEYFDFDDFAFSCADTIDAISSHDKIVIYPNPGNGKFYCFNKTPGELTGNLVISDLTGKKVFQMLNIELKRFEIITLDLHFLKPAFYIFTFYNKEFREPKKIIVDK